MCRFFYFLFVLIHSRYFLVDIFFFFLELHTLEECTGSGELSVRPLFGYVGVCILYLFMHCLYVLSFHTSFLVC